ncbi:MAG TPA: cellulase family glycosylhydrolase [Capsulimonadaceae bacterium]|jgi:hypothetical protein
MSDYATLHRLPGASLIVALTLLIVCAIPSYAVQQASHAQNGAGAPPAGLTTRPLPALHVANKQFADTTGKAVLLTGVNLGGWLVTEGWMCGDKQSDRFLLERLESRFGPERAAKLMDAWYDNWITLADLDRVRSYGFNVVRVPFGYRNLQNAAGEWKRLPNGEIDFTRLDWIVREAGRRGIYVVLDLHIWSGQKEQYQAVSRLQPLGDTQRAFAAALWGAVAKHFKGNGTVAGFDLVNEPEGSAGDTLQKALLGAVRREDPDRIVMGEGQYYTNFKEPIFANSVWSAHYPDDKAPGTVDEKVERWSSSQRISQNPDVPCAVFMGEIKSPEDNETSARDLGNALSSRGWSWAVWCYKGVNVGGWASFNYYQDSVHYDSATDSYESLMDVFSKRLRQWQDPTQPKNWYQTDWWVAGYGKAATYAQKKSAPLVQH